MAAQACHTPIRTCVVCGSRKAKNTLLRLALSVEAGSTVKIDPAGRSPGRGAYVCAGCLSGLRFTKRVQKAFRGRAHGLSIQEHEASAVRERSYRYPVQSKD